MKTIYCMHLYTQQVFSTG